MHFCEDTIRLAQDTPDRIICQEDILAFNELKVKVNLTKAATNDRECFKNYL